jgi:hypothetical protein
MRKIVTSLLMAASVQACVTSSGGAPPSSEPAAETRPSAGGMAVRADAPGGARLERRGCDPKQQRERSGREPRPQIEGGVQSDGRPYAAGGCAP